ncbi:DUF3300 domain-containing protein [Alteromonas lipolytica]|uniref:DUF3300 domain-containing protein n=1 Tax=Alteromonas lipolytica TaxID=1856405 RepID=A0A1E8FD92_9ALTE|nr:DUF3300 domain-containing protein [Alteromonas lipolytica]OFI33453.1 hypothetical protein BFC17_04120 [Alteromonas lipolytica]GGF59549.1 hypothetical protein GCM10011338_09760 [Alteromonas lipolytica]
MKKRIVLALLLPLICGGEALARTAPEQPTEATVAHLNQETLDNLLAPIALYPDTLVTHILIASTYPFQVVEADRWRQDNPSLAGNSLEQALTKFDWDPSIKALVPFNDILHHMSDDLSWLQQLGDAVLTNEDWVLDRVQALRLQAMQSGNLQSNDYQQISAEEKVIVIESRQPDVVYVPYYDPRYVYGHWHYHSTPVFWPAAVKIALGHRIYWGPHVSISAGFYFSNIWWPERHIVIRSTPVHRYVRPVYSVKHARVKEYHRWQHNTASRHARYSRSIVTEKPALARQHRSVTTVARHRELYNKTRAVSAHSQQKTLNKRSVDNKPIRKEGPRQDAKGFEQRLKRDETGKQRLHQQADKNVQPHRSAGNSGSKAKEFTRPERPDAVARHPKERQLNSERQRVSKRAEPGEKRQSHEARVTRSGNGAHSKPSRPDHAQQGRASREH